MRLDCFSHGSFTWCLRIVSSPKTWLFYHHPPKLLRTFLKRNFITYSNYSPLILSLDLHLKEYLSCDREFLPFFKEHIPCRRRRGQINTHKHTHTHAYIYIYIYIQCLIFHCRPLSRRSPARTASRLLRVSVSGAFLRPAGGSCRVENLNSSVYVYHANLQSQNCETPVSCDTCSEIFSGYVLTFVLSHRGLPL